MSEPFNLYYGDFVEVKVTASDHLGMAESLESQSEHSLSPYIVGQLEFGNSDYYEFDNENGVYPSDLTQLTITPDLGLSSINILETKGY